MGRGRYSQGPTANVQTLKRSRCESERSLRARQGPPSQQAVLERCRELQDEVRRAGERLAAGERSAAVVDGLWRAEALGTLLWALGLAELPGYDQPFVAADVARAAFDGAQLRSRDELEHAHETARLWHWRARTAALVRDDDLPLPSTYASADQLVAATAMRGHELGVLPLPLRGDFRVFGTSYRLLEDDELLEAHSLALERHHALSWLRGLGDWDEVSLDT